jgi:4-hydroxyphenylpyruvate dioxygenase-like putative hemolysin
MVDADEEGYLLQILQNQYKTDLTFFEIIQRMERLVQVILKLCLSL